jgi:hypothetical protein
MCTVDYLFIKHDGGKLKSRLLKKYDWALRKRNGA